ncbi:FG-GAP-like repeat-containing protein [bacterium]|nr:FG-GAP-like repeat-containing protein [bacterium]
MAYVKTIDERYYGGFLQYYAGDLDAPSILNGIAVLADGSTGYGFLTDAYSLGDIDIYSLGILDAGYYSVDVDGYSWDYTEFGYGSVSSFQVLNSYGGVVDTNYGTYSDIEFTVTASSTYYVKIEGSSYSTEQYRVSYTKTGELVSPNTPAVFSNSSETRNIVVDETITSSINQTSTVSGFVRDRMGVIMQDITILKDGEIVTKSAKNGSYTINVHDPALTELFHFEYSDGLLSRSITASDALEALRISVGLPTESGEADAYQLIAADVNQDGRVTSADALEILKHSVGIETTAAFGWEFFDTAQTDGPLGDLLENFEFDLRAHNITTDTEIDLTGILLGDVNDTSGFELRAQPRIVEVRSSVIDIGEQSNVPAPFASEAYDIYNAIYPSLTPYWWYAVRGMPHLTYKTDEGYVVLKSAMFQYHDSTELSPLVFVIDEGKNIVSANSFDTVELESTFAYAEATVGGVSGTIVAEAAAELAGLPFTEWPYGNLWFSHLDENESLSLTPLLDVKSQWADVGVGDINLDGLDDIVAVHLGSYDGDWRSLRLYTQNDDGSFSKDNDFFKFLDAPSGVVDNHWIDHSVTVADLNGDGLLEIIEGTYNVSTEVPLFQIHSTDGGGVYHLEVAEPREGVHASLGLVDAQAADLDGDGDLDLVFKTEGLGADALGNGFILYRNDGDFVFTDVTDEWSGHSLYIGLTFGITNVHVIDLDGDGSLDIFTEHYGEVPNSDWSSKNLGALIHLNDGTGHLEWQGDNPDLIVPGISLKDGITSYFLGVEQGIVDIMMVYPDQTVSVLTADLNFL